MEKACLLVKVSIDFFGLVYPLEFLRRVGSSLSKLAGIQRGRLLHLKYGK